MTIQELQDLNNQELVEIFEAVRDRLNLQTIQTFRKRHGLSYNGVQFQKNLRTRVQKTQYIVDNDRT